MESSSENYNNAKPNYMLTHITKKYSTQAQPPAVFNQFLYSQPNLCHTLATIDKKFLPFVYYEDGHNRRPETVVKKEYVAPVNENDEQVVTFALQDKRFPFTPYVSQT